MSRHDDDERREEVDTREIHTQAGVSDGIVGNDETTLTGRGTEADQEEASDFYEEIGALIEGKDEEDLHTADLVDEAEEE